MKCRLAVRSGRGAYDLLLNFVFRPRVENRELGCTSQGFGPAMATVEYR